MFALVLLCSCVQNIRETISKGRGTRCDECWGGGGKGQKKHTPLTDHFGGGDLKQKVRSMISAGLIGDDDGKGCSITQFFVFWAWPFLIFVRPPSGLREGGYRERQPEKSRGGGEVGDREIGNEDSEDAAISERSDVLFFCWREEGKLLKESPKFYHGAQLKFYNYAPDKILPSPLKIWPPSPENYQIRIDYGRIGMELFDLCYRANSTSHKNIYSGQFESLALCLAKKQCRIC